MAIVTAENMNAQAEGFGSLPAVKQVGLLVGLALSVALGVTVAMWSQAPNYVLLHGDLNPTQLSQVTSLLTQANIKYKLEGMGMVMVPADKIQQAKMKIAGQGVSVGNTAGYELLDKEQGLGSSSFLQKARLHRAMEGELARSIGQLNFVEAARVHLAIPRQSAFARKTSQPTASVVISLLPGRVLDEVQIAGIVNMVASAVPELDSEHVSVIDHKGRLLNNPERDAEMKLSSTQFDYTRKLEQRYMQSIIDIISPITGLDGVRSQVVADLDFTVQEQTSESYQPNNQAVRSEQLFEQNGDNAVVAGVPGALSNQPPTAGTLQPQGRTNEEAAAVSNSTTRAVRNYEIDRTISHVRQNPVTITKLSIAVLVDHTVVADAEGNMIRQPRSDEEIAYITSLVKDATGFNEERGDTLNVVNTSFMQPMEIEPAEAPPIWEQPWVWDLARQGLGALAVLFIAFGVLRPMLKNLSSHGNNQLQQTVAATALPAGEHAAAPQQGALPGTANQAALPEPGATTAQLREAASNIAREDPRRVAEIMNRWVAADE